MATEDGFRPQKIQLANPVANQFSTFAFGNALFCDHVVEEGAGEGQTVAICGAGPSLNETADKWLPRADQVWGCNSAAITLVDRGLKCTHAFTVDQTPSMLVEWKTAPDLEYICASTMHPNVTKYLLDKNRKIVWFHNYVGMDQRPVSYSVCNACDMMGDGDATECAKCKSTDLHSGCMEFEDWMYANLYPPTLRAGSGLNAVTRAIDVAEYMGFKKILVLGADCAVRIKTPRPKTMVDGSPEHMHWLENETVMHADGGHALASGATPVMLSGMVDGRLWTSKPDMLISAVWLVKMKRRLGSRLSILGDTLPKALMDKSDEFLARLPTLVDHNDVPIGIDQ